MARQCSLHVISAITAYSWMTSVIILEQDLDSLWLRLDDPIAETVLLAWKNCQDTLKRQDLSSTRCWKPSLLLQSASDTSQAQTCSSHGPPLPRERPNFPSLYSWKWAGPCPVSGTQSPPASQQLALRVCCTCFPSQYVNGSRCF